MISVISSLFDSTTGENTTTGCVNRLFVIFCDMSQKAIDITGYGPRPCGVCVTPRKIVIWLPTIQNSDAILWQKSLYKIDTVFSNPQTFSGTPGCERKVFVHLQKSTAGDAREEEREE